MNTSSNELQVAVLKACRGVGLPIAQAQEVAAAVAASPQAIPDFLQYLSQPFQKVGFDFTNGLEVKNANILQDFSVCADAAISGESSVVIRDFDRCELIIALAKHRGVMVKTQSNDLSISKGAASELLFERCNLSTKDWAAIGQYAALTYVPETDQSRIDGAGAGLTDND
ncbi:hypothetical protein N9P15_01000 [Planktomarina sp.]|nr:hypothetical protein [Planktomarina sp.]